MEPIRNKKGPFAVIPLLVLALAIPLIADVHAGERKSVKPTAKDRCPVCGMFVAKYPDWAAKIVFKDGTHVFFDGAKDMFKYYFNLRKYHPSKTLSDIDFILVTDYYALDFIDGYRAIFVIGSDVRGPMGRELIPFEKDGDAKEFIKDHKGTSMIGFKQVTSEVIRGLD